MKRNLLLSSIVLPAPVLQWKNVVALPWLQSLRIWRLHQTRDDSHSSYPDFLAFSPDGTALASLGSGLNVTRTSSGGITVTLSSADQVLRLWNLSTGVELARVNIGSDALSTVSFSGDWSLLVTGSGNNGNLRVFRRAN